MQLNIIEVKNDPLHISTKIEYVSILEFVPDLLLTFYSFKTMCKYQDNTNSANFERSVNSKPSSKFSCNAPIIT